MKPNIFLIVIDSFNAEKFLGSKKTSITPTIDKLIENGTYFSQAIAVAPTTVPAVSSIFTGLYPSLSITKNGKILKINDNIKNYVDKLREEGYHTHALVPKILKLVNLETIFKENVIEFDSFSTLYDGVGDQILTKLDFDFKEPWFCYVHLMDLHGEATFHLSEWPKKFENRHYGENRYERMVSSLDFWLEKIIKKINLEDTIIVLTADHGSFAAYYDQDMEIQNDLSNKKRETSESISYKIGHKIFTNLPNAFNPLRKSVSEKYIERRNKKIDSEIQNQIKETNFDELRPYEKRLLENSIKPTAKLFDEICRIPLLFSGYKIPKNIKISSQVKNSDIFPTLFDLIGLNNEITSFGQNLTPLINGNSIKESDVFIQSITNSDEESVVGIRTEYFKYFRKINDPDGSAMLFDLKNDPHEEINLINRKKDLVEKFEHKLTEFLKQMSPQNPNLTEDDEVEAELKKLGYL